jgi:hypothetical protein
MPCQSRHPDTTPVIRNVGSVANRQNQQKRGSSVNSQLPPAKRRVLVPADERDSSQGGSFVPSTIQGHHSTPSSSLNNPRVANITEHVTYTLSAIQRRSIITPTSTLDKSSHNTPAPSGNIQTDSTRRNVSCLSSGISSTPTPLSGLYSLPTPIRNPEARAMITNLLRTRATQKNQRQRLWQLQPQLVSTRR